MKIIVIGGGPAGLFSAISASQHGETIVLEKGPKSGRKLLLTGSGQCNLTHDCTPEELLNHFHDPSFFLRHALHKFTPQDTIRFFEKHGTSCITEPNGKVFPASRDAQDVLSVLEAQCRKHGVTVHTHRRVVSAEKQGRTFRVVCGSGNEYFCDRLILALGGKSYPATGSSGDGYALAQSFGHTVIEPRPALCGIRTVEHPLKEFSGLSFSPASITVRRENQEILKNYDDLLITAQGFSGPVIMDRSGHIRAGDLVEIDFTGRGNEFLQELLELHQGGGSHQFSSLFTRLGLPRRLVKRMLSMHGFSGEKRSAETGKKELMRAAALFTRAEFTAGNPLPLSSAMITAGGIDIKEINSSTMESRLVSGLYAAGEIINIQGDTGGFNLQAAWSTGYLAGRSCVSDANLIL